MTCQDQLNNFCDEDIDSKCLNYTGPLSTNTTITDDCVDQHKVNEDLYAIIEQYKTIIEDLTSRIETLETP